jgi:hypothetical protein
VEEYVLSDQLPTDENGSHLLCKRATDWAAS